MLEEILKSINLNLEKISKSQEERNILLKQQFEPISVMKPQDIVKKAVTEPVAPVMPNNTQPTPVVQIPNAQMPEPVQIPVSNQAESFTQEQIARAMASAMDAGNQAIIQQILSTFNAQSLMDINPQNYNQVATMLRGAGIKI